MSHPSPDTIAFHTFLQYDAARPLRIVSLNSFRIAPEWGNAWLVLLDAGELVKDRDLKTGYLCCTEYKYVTNAVLNLTPNFALHPLLNPLFLPLLLSFCLGLRIRFKMSTSTASKLSGSIPSTSSTPHSVPVHHHNPYGYVPTEWICILFVALFAVSTGESSARKDPQ